MAWQSGDVLILVPPSEGKAVPRRGRALDLDQLVVPRLAAARARVLDALVELCADPEAARSVLGLSAGQADEVRRNAALRTAPTAAASAIYNGVLYDSLGLATLSPAAKRAASRSLLVFSGLWGVLRLADRIPSYRCSIGVRLPGVGQLSSYWKAHLAAPLTELAGRQLVLDLRSSAYVAAWSPPGAKVVTVRVLHERLVAGVPTRSVVSHFNKATKGRLVRDLLEAGANPRTPAALAATLKDLGYQVEGATPGSLDLIVTSL